MEDNRDLFPTKDDLANYGYVLWNALREIFNSRYGTVYGLANIAEDALMEFRVKSQMHGKEYIENTFVLKRKKVYCSDCVFYLTIRDKHTTKYIERWGQNMHRRGKIRCIDFGDQIRIEQEEMSKQTISCSECSHPKNINKWYYDGLAEPNRFIEKVSTINKNNNCSWFTVKLDGRN